MRSVRRSCSLKIPVKISVLCKEADVCSSICYAGNVTNIFLKKKEVACFTLKSRQTATGSMA